MVNIFIDIVSLKCVIRMIKLELLRQEFRAIHGDKMGSTIDSVKVNDGVLRGIVCSISWTNYPHPCVFVCSIADFVKPTDHSAGIHFAPVLE